MPVITNIQDLKDLHKKRTPKMFYEYCESGSWTEQTFAENTSDFEKIRLRQKVAVDMTNRTTETTILGTKATMPVALAPVGVLGMQCPDGEIKAARAASDFGVPFTLSTMSICSLEDVAAASPDPIWFQLYVMKDRGFIEALINRAKTAGCSALVLTLDLQILGQRHNDIRNGLSAPPKMTLKNMVNMTLKQRWAWGMLGTKNHGFGNIVGHVTGVDDMSSLSEWTAKQFDPALSWDDVEWIKKCWGGPLIIKGVMDAEDARNCVNAGADALVVSNHGGRQLDGALSSIRALPEIVDAVKGEIEIMIDSGIRSGQDVLKAIALGADHTMIGRAFVYGLGAMGQEGVTKSLSVIHKELDTTLALCGGKTMTDLNRDKLFIPKDFDPRDAYL